MLGTGGTITVVGVKGGDQSVNTVAGLRATPVLVRLLADGRNDPTFGSGGVVRAALPAEFLTFGNISADLAPDGRLYLATSGYPDSDTDGELLLTRYDATGRFDADFGPGTAGGAPDGFALAGREVPAPLYVTGSAVGGDGSVVFATGRRYVAGPSAAARLRADGRPDPAFGGGGFASTFAAGQREFLTDATVQADGRVVVVGRSEPFTFAGGYKPSAAFAARFLVDGRPDPSFGTLGRVRLPELGDGFGYLTRVAPLPDGRLLVSGYGRDSDGPTAPFVARLRSDGRLDPTFADGGVRVVDLPGDGREETVILLAPLPDGTIMIGGGVLVSKVRPSPTAASGTAGYPDDADVYAARLTADGAFDPTYGDRGAVVIDGGVGDDDVSDAAVLPGGGVALLGGSQYLVTPGSAYSAVEYRPTVTRITADGRPEAGFGDSGRPAWSSSLRTAGRT